MHSPRGHTADRPHRPVPPQRLLLLDLDNTAVSREAAVARWAHDFALEHHLDTNAAAWLITTDNDGLTPRERFFTEVRNHFSLTPTPEELHRAYQDRYPRHMHCGTAVLDHLAKLRARGWTVGVVTNGLTRTQGAVLEHTGLTRYLDGWCISEAEGIRKPDPELFARTATRCGRDISGGGWMIGDSIEADIGGAKRAGLHTIWIRRGRTWPQSLPPPDHTADDVTAALEHLAQAHTESGARPQ